jgi:thiosulfate/3-mercaptopyruvate sulfurtransferase
MSFRTLISTSVLAAHLDDPYVVIDCRFKLDDEEWGRREYQAGHIPGAAYAHLGIDLSGPMTGANGRHPLPDADVLSKTFSRFGIEDGVQVVAYDQDNGMYASRLWWLLRWAGHDTVAVLDGGIAKWKAEGRPVTTGTETGEPRTFVASPRRDLAVDVSRVQSLLHDRSWRLVDARAGERYRGEVEPIDKVAGHIPGAINHPFVTNLAENGTYRTPEALRVSLRESLGDTPADHVVCYCGSGVTACANLLALEHAGLAGAKLYAGSWSEWSSDPARPVERNG